MNLIKQLNKIREVFQRGENMMDYMRAYEKTGENSQESIMIAYDFQAGNYIKKSGELEDFELEYAQKVVAEIIRNYEFDSILEVGVGEGTTLRRILNELNKPELSIFGFDISWSRIKFAQKLLKDNGILNTNLFVGDLFHIPLQDSSVDLVYTSHSLEPNGGREKEAILELCRVAKKYVYLVEPSYEYGNEKTKEYIDQHRYVKGLAQTARELGLDVIEDKLIMKAHPRSDNNTGITVIKMAGTSTQPSLSPFACPVSRSPIEELRGSYYCKQSMLAYPVIDGIPCLLPGNALIATHYLDDNL